MQTPTIVRRVGFNQFTTIPNTKQPKYIKVLDPKTLKVSIVAINK